MPEHNHHDDHSPISEWWSQQSGVKKALIGGTATVTALTFVAGMAFVGSTGPHTDRMLGTSPSKTAGTPVSVAPAPKR